ncbi:hypothetical protein LIER_28996 [Lithospermum erythrorhizon]|uniref:Uncharacterized protein n=1 Tax=Lithospermum erythrorhizon TaxID=34254 RepID=A0AAV3RHN2_LITER
MEKTIKEVRLARLVASHWSHYLLDGVIFYSRTSSPRVHFSFRKIYIFSDPDDGGNVHGLTFKNPNVGDHDVEEDVEAFASLLTEPTADVTGSSKVTPKKQKHKAGKGSRKAPKKSKINIIVEGVEGTEEVPPTEPGVKDSQILEGPRGVLSPKVTFVSITLFTKRF